MRQSDIRLPVDLWSQLLKAIPKRNPPLRKLRFGDMLCSDDTLSIITWITKPNATTPDYTSFYTFDIHSEGHSWHSHGGHNIHDPEHGYIGRCEDADLLQRLRTEHNRIAIHYGECMCCGPQED